MNLQREDEAVSSTIATVLLFGGVVSIIGMMMASMMPVILEMQGSIERNDMAAQMGLLAQRADALAETGMPGDAAHVEIRPIDGALRWDETASGMWYAATWAESHTLRSRGLLDFDAEFDVRHQESETTAVCLDDLRLGADRPFHYTTPSWAESMVLSVTPGVAETLGPVKVKPVDDGEDLALRAGDVVTLDPAPTGLTADAALTVVYLRGDGGAMLAPPSDEDPVDGTGRAWTLPLPSGLHRVHMTAADRAMVDWNVASQQGRAIMDETAQAQIAHGSTFVVNLSSASLLHVTSSAPADMVVHLNHDEGHGRAVLNAHRGPSMGTSFLPPDAQGRLILTNPGQGSATVTWRGDGRTIAPGGHVDVDWPPAGAQGPAWLTANARIGATWVAGNGTADGVRMLPASDTGGPSGLAFDVRDTASTYHDIMLSGVRSTVMVDNSNTSLDVEANTTHALSSVIESRINATGDGLRVTEVVGNHGASVGLHDGEARCLTVGVEASGWVRLALPWSPTVGFEPQDQATAWRQGLHPSGLEMRVYGEVDGDDLHPIGSVYAVHLSRLQYAFQSSIIGMEVAYAGGAVMTNHPEFDPLVLRAPTDRGGPGPRFAATIPAMHPSVNSPEGSGAVDLTMTLQSRDVMASAPAFEVRRGWTGPYGGAVAEVGSYALEG
ncbi:MAG: hypothetical protein ACPH5S_02535, partial [Candidatus Poseidoniaceae archaeon]